VDIFEIIIPIISKCCKDLNIGLEDFTNSFLKFEKDIISFFEEVSSMDVFSSLMLKRDLSNRAIDRNDVYDMGFLATAIPYCDVVVTEVYWKSVYYQTGLNKNYSTRVMETLLELESVLNEV